MVGLDTILEKIKKRRRGQEVQDENEPTPNLDANPTRVEAMTQVISPHLI
jgi:hypothetical protein